MIGDRWGVTDEEVARRYPCDELVPNGVLPLWRGVTVQATVAEVWPWLRMLQLSPYSYDWIDNLGRRSPRTLQDLPEPAVGDRFTRMGGRFGVGRVLAVEPGAHLTATILGAVMTYQLVPSGAQTRLLLKIVLRQRRWWGPALALGDWPMARKQLLNLRELAAQGDPG